MGGTSRLEILQLLMAGTVEEQLHADLQRERAAAEARERWRGAGEDGGAEHAEGMQARLLNALKLLRPADDPAPCADPLAATV